jgi:4'-phosphopantetheinyl transferase EntD
MTESARSRGAAGSYLAVPAALPAFASFATAGPLEPPVTGHEDAESTVLHPRAVAARRRSFRLGRAAAHAALATIGRDEGPILAGDDRRPIWPEGVSGSISHTADLGVALAAPADRTDGVGLDIEARRCAPELDTRVPRAEERRWLAGTPAAGRDDLLLALFSAKESIYKAFYPRIQTFFGFEAASLVPGPGGFTARLVVDLDCDYPPERTFPVHVEWHGDRVLTWLVLEDTHHRPHTAA